MPAYDAIHFNPPAPLAKVALRNPDKGTESWYRRDASETEVFKKSYFFSSGEAAVEEITSSLALIGLFF
ncbi:MAG: hypothetical protein DRI61_06360 [Chloroflexi bacterium]|nr:MAG: hypothetical protein DRI61_06360 [Chloroflexota bacterium]